MTPIYILGALLVVVVFVAIGIYNGIIRSKNNVHEAESAIDTVFQNRYDLIPNLVTTVSEYAKHEKGLLMEVTKLRTQLMGAQDDKTASNFEKQNMLSGALKSLFAVSENYPDLRANENFINLQNQWTEIEDRLQAARRTYNSAVKDLRNKKEQIPSNLIAAQMNLPSFDMFDSDEQATKSLNAKELFNS